MLRTECDTVDYSSFLYHLRKMKDEYEGTARRLRYTIGRSKGSARHLRRKLVDAGNYADWAKERCHEWSRRIITYCQSVGVGKLVVLPIANQDWPAYQFVLMLKYKGAAVNIDVTDESGASITDESVDRALSASVKTRQRTAKRVREAVRTLESTYQ
jgi:transposase